VKKYLFFFVFGLCLGPLAYGQTFPEALRAIKKLEAKTTVGTGFNSYLDSLGNVKFEVNQFLESDEGKSNLELGNGLKKILGHYEMAGNLWMQKTKSRIIGKRSLRPEVTDPAISAHLREIPRERNRLIQQQNNLIDEILSLYPELNKKIADGGAIINPSVSSLDLGIAIKIIWAKAAEEIESLPVRKLK
jgi:hypothetical protein